MKLLRKSKGKWVAVSLASATMLYLAPNQALAAEQPDTESDRLTEQVSESHVLDVSTNRTNAKAVDEQTKESFTLGTQAAREDVEATVSKVAGRELERVEMSVATNETTEADAREEVAANEMTEASTSEEATTNDTKEVVANEELVSQSVGDEVAPEVVMTSEEHGLDAVESAKEELLTDPTADRAQLMKRVRNHHDALALGEEVPDQTAAMQVTTVVRQAPDQSYRVYEHAVYGQYIDAREFGVDTTGVQDSHRAIQKAIDVAHKEQVAVYLHGNIRLDAPISITQATKNVKGIFGDGIGKTVITFTKVQDGIFDSNTNLEDLRPYSAIVVDGVDHQILADFTVTYRTDDVNDEDHFYMEGVPYHGKINGIMINDASHTLVTGVEAHNFNRAGILFFSTKANTIEKEQGAKKSFIDRLKSHEITEEYATLPIGVDNRVEHSYSHHNRVAGVFLGYQKNFVAESNRFEYNGHVRNGGTGYGIATIANSYNFGVTFRSNQTRHNYRKGLDIHDGNRILIEKNISYGDRLYGISVYNRWYLMDDVQILNNVVEQDPSHRIPKDRDTSITYNEYAAIYLQTNEKFQDFKATKDGRFVIANNVIKGLEVLKGVPKNPTIGIEVRNGEIAINYDLTIENNQIKGNTAHAPIRITNDTGHYKYSFNKEKKAWVRYLAQKGPGSGNIRIRNNEMILNDVPVNLTPITITEANAADIARGSVVLERNRLHILNTTEGVSKAVEIRGNAERYHIIDNEFDLGTIVNTQYKNRQGVAVEPQRSIVTVVGQKDVANQIAVVTGNTIKTNGSRIIKIDGTAEDKPLDYLLEGKLDGKNTIVMPRAIQVVQLTQQSADNRYIPQLHEGMVRDIAVVGLQEHVQTDTMAEEYQTEYIDDETLALGEKVLHTNGKAGERTVVTKQWLNPDGEIVYSRMVEDHVTMIPTNQVFRRGIRSVADAGVVPVTEAQPVVEVSEPTVEAPITEAQPVVEVSEPTVEAPITEVQPVVEDSKPVVEAPVTEAQPVVEVSEPTVEAPVTEAQPAAEESKSTVETPATEKMVAKKDRATLEAEEKQAALAKVGTMWDKKSVDEIRQEIARQYQAGLTNYVIQWGDTLQRLAQAANVNVEQLAQQNNIADVNRIYTGRFLTGILPTTSEVAQELSRQTSEASSTKLSQGVERIKAEIQRQQQQGATQYTIQRGDTLNAISQATGISVDEIVKTNRIANRDLIYTGHTLKGLFTIVAKHVPITPSTQSEAEQSTRSNGDVSSNGAQANMKEDRVEHNVVQEAKPTQTESTTSNNLRDMFIETERPTVRKVGGVNPVLKVYPSSPSGLNSDALALEFAKVSRKIEVPARIS